MYERHGMTGTVEYEAYIDAKQRCLNTNNKRYVSYGGRGIEFRFESFGEFFKCVGLRPSKNHSLDRVNNDGHYEIGNVRWATKEEQNGNRRERKRLSHTRGTSFIPNQKCKPWQAQIGIHGVVKYLGCFKTEKEAHQAYLEARKQHE